MAEVHGKDTRIYINEFDVSGWMTNADVGGEREQAEVSAYGDNVKQYLPGVADGMFSFEGNFDGGAALTTIDGILSPLKGGSVLALLAPRGTATLGLEAWISSGVLNQFSIESSVADAVRISAQVHGGGPYPGVFVMPEATYTVTGNGTSVDNGAASTFGGRVQLHVTSNSHNNTVDFKLQHSTDNSAWSDVSGGTFTQIAAGVETSQQLVLSGTINRYTRIVRTFAGTGNVIAAAALYRNVQ